MQFRRPFMEPTVVKAADGAANTNTTAQWFFRAPVACEVISAHIIPIGTLTAHDTTYATITLEKATPGTTLGTAATVASVTTKTTDSGDWLVGVPVELTLEAQPAIYLDAGDVLGFKIDKASTGVTVPASAVQVHIRGLSEL